MAVLQAELRGTEACLKQAEKHELQMAAERGSIHAEAEQLLREREKKHEHAREELSKTLVLMAALRTEKQTLGIQVSSLEAQLSPEVGAYCLPQPLLGRSPRSSRKP